MKGLAGALLLWLAPAAAPLEASVLRVPAGTARASLPGVSFRAPALGIFSGARGASPLASFSLALPSVASARAGSDLSLPAEAALVANTAAAAPASRSASRTLPARGSLESGARGPATRSASTAFWDGAREGARSSPEKGAVRVLGKPLHARSRLAAPESRARIDSSAEGTVPAGRWARAKSSVGADFRALGGALKELKSRLLFPRSFEAVRGDLRALGDFFLRLKSLGWKAIAAVLAYYLVRDSILYILIPYLILRGASGG